MAPELPKNESARDRILAFLKKNVGKVVTAEQLADVAQIHEWARRVRELRDEFGYRISSFNDRGYLKPGQYVLESLDPGPANPRKSAQRARILARDGSTCQMCGNAAGDPDPDDPNKKIRLHIDHITPISQGGDESDDNLRAICSVCNQGRSNLHLPDKNSIKVLSLIRRNPRDVQREVYEFLKQKFENDSAS